MKELRKYNITTRETAVLLTIQYSGGNASLGEIARLLMRQNHTIYEIVRRMELRGLVRRIKSQGRNSPSRITSTKKGQQAFSNAMKMDSINQIFSSLSKEDSQKLNAYLEILRDKAYEIVEMERKPIFP